MMCPMQQKTIQVDKYVVVLDAEEDKWRDPSQLKSDKKCNACLKRGGLIQSDFNKISFRFNQERMQTNQQWSMISRA